MDSHLRVSTITCIERQGIDVLLFLILRASVCWVGVKVDFVKDEGQRAREGSIFASCSYCFVRLQCPVSSLLQRPLENAQANMHMHTLK
jgi:hypothetical protein